ncbi:uncharacterized protein LOC141592195 isoform X1 [Silene latifolia]|uniref:uncharacterized protein LOC141592195 isoform X1 n=1 Tax=Silene latifolia TaxID=37657 RepID=UPI003D77938A
MDDLDSSNFDQDTNGFSLIDVSAFDDDFLLSSSSDANAVDNQGDILEEGTHVEKPSDLLAVQRPRKPGKCNLRKSLAWDTAFFTSAGVLDAEELSSIMEGAETGPKQNHRLPGIQEELSKSTDSITTFESDSLTLESLEADLFCDIRASIQRSSKSSISGNDNVEGKSGNVRSRKIGQPSSGNIVKPRLASRKLVPAAQGLAASRMLKPTSISKQVNKPVVRGKESSSTLPRSPAATGKPSLEGTTASKRMSVGTTRAKSEIHHAGNGKGVGKEALISKGPRQVDSRNASQKALTSSRLSASSVFNGNAIPSSHSSYDSSSSSSNTSTTKKPYSQNSLGVATSLSSSENIRKSLLDVRRKIDKNANLPPGSKIRTPSRVPVKGKSQPGECKLSAYVKSTSNLSPSISPASSISEWSIESSSSNATVNQNQSLRHCSTTIDVTADRNLSQNMQMHSNDKALDSHDYQVVKQPSTGPAFSQARPGSAKPSGLRLPSPKIGFFDGAKAGTKTPSGSARSRSAIPSNLLKSATGNNSPSGISSKAKPGSVVKLSLSAAGRPGSTKLDPQRSHASPKLSKQRQDDNVDLPSGINTGSFSEVSETTFATGHASPKLSKQLQADIVDLPSGNDSNTFSEVPITTLAKSHASPILTKQLQDDIVDFQSCNDSGTFSEALITSPILTKQLQGDIVNLQSGNDSCTFSEVTLTTSAKSHASPTLTKQLQDDIVDLQSGDDSGTFSEVSITTLAKSLASPTLTKPLHDDIVDLQSGNDSGALSEVSITTLAESHASPILTKQLQDDIVDLQSGKDSGTLSEVSITTSAKSHASPTLTKSLQDDIVDLLSGNDSGTLSEVSITTLAKSHASPTLTKQLQDDIVDLQSGKDSGTFSEVSTNTLAKSDGIPILTEQVQVDIVDLASDNDSGAFSEILVNTLAESTSERNSIVAEHTDGGKHVESCSETKNNPSGELEDSATMIVNGGSDPTIELPKSTSTKSALELNYKVSEDDYAEKLSSETSFDDQPETNSELLDNFAAIKEAGEENELQSGIDQVIDLVADGGPHFSCTSSLPDNGVNQGSRTPFAVKNLVSDVEESNSLTVLTSDAFVKIDAMPPHENIVNFDGKDC